MEIFSKWEKKKNSTVKIKMSFKINIQQSIKKKKED